MSTRGYVDIDVDYMAFTTPQLRIRFAGHHKYEGRLCVVRVPWSALRRIAADVFSSYVVHLAMCADCLQQTQSSSLVRDCRTASTTEKKYSVLRTYIQQLSSALVVIVYPKTATATSTIQYAHSILHKMIFT